MCQRERNCKNKKSKSCKTCWYGENYRSRRSYNHYNPDPEILVTNQSEDVLVRNERILREFADELDM